MNDLDDLLAGGDRLQDIGANRLFRRLIDKPAHHRQRNVGLQQRDPHLAHGLAHVGFIERAAPTQLVEYAA